MSEQRRSLRTSDTAGGDPARAVGPVSVRAGVATIESPLMLRPTDFTIYSCGDVEFDCDERVVRVNGRRQELTFGESELLFQLMQRKGHTLTRRELQSASLQDADSSLRSIDVLVLRIRQKLADARRFAIETVPQLGYRCVEPG